MGRAVVYMLIATAFAGFFVFSPHDRKDQELTRRLGYKFRAPTFDPLVEEMERLAEEGKLEKTGKGNQVTDAYRHYYDEGRLNISLRLLVLFPLLDQSPKDGVISYEELSHWITGQAIERLNYRTQKELASRDKNGDGAISFLEYLPQFTEEDIGRPFVSLTMLATKVEQNFHFLAGLTNIDYGIEFKIETARNETGYGEAGWWKKQFTNADVDPNGLLSFDELKE